MSAAKGRTVFFGNGHDVQPVFVAEIKNVARPTRAGVINRGAAIGPGMDQAFQCPTVAAPDVDFTGGAVRVFNREWGFPPTLKGQFGVPLDCQEGGDGLSSGLSRRHENNRCPSLGLRFSF